jgi:hypothetical protein
MPANTPPYHHLKIPFAVKFWPATPWFVLSRTTAQKSFNNI